MSKPPSPRADQLRKQREERYEAEQKRQAEEAKRINVKKRGRAKINSEEPFTNQKIRNTAPNS
jgi:uncharacterized protein (DUF2249 family)